MKKGKTIGVYGDEVPTLREFLAVIIVATLMTALAWIAYYKFGWLH